MVFGAVGCGDDDDDDDASGCNGGIFRSIYLYAWPSYTLHIAMINDKFMMCYELTKWCQEPTASNYHLSLFSIQSFSLDLNVSSMLFISMSMWCDVMRCDAIPFCWCYHQSLCVCVCVQILIEKFSACVRTLKTRLSQSLSLSLSLNEIVPAVKPNKLICILPKRLIGFIEWTIPLAFHSYRIQSAII